MRDTWLLCLSVCVLYGDCFWFALFFFFQAEDGIRDLVRSRGLGDVYKRQAQAHLRAAIPGTFGIPVGPLNGLTRGPGGGKI